MQHICIICFTPIVHKFQFILDDIGEVHKDKNFAILIDEAHSSQNGSLSAKMNMVLSGSVYEDEDELEDKINTFFMFTVIY